ncbi:hypothetical protein LguiB_001694 [Lonicera macranthoides]
MNNDQLQMMNQSQILNHSQRMNQQQQQKMSSMNKTQMLNHQRQIMNNLNSQMLSSQMNNQSQMLNRGGYGMWPPVDQLKYQNPSTFPGFVPPNNQFNPMGRNNWNAKKGIDKRRDIRRKENPVTGGAIAVGAGGGGGYKPPSLKELQHQNRLKARRYFPNKKKSNNRFAPHAPRNTTSFIIRAKKSGGVASLVSPCPVTPAVLPTPIFSPSREVLVDTAKEEWGVDGYGSMKGLIRLRSPGNDDEEEDEGGSSESDVEEHLEVERRLDHDLSRFEMIYPNYGGSEYNNNVMENRVDDQDTHIAQVEEENMFLKHRLFLMERELADLRRRLMRLERQNQVVEEINQEVMENESDNESGSRGYSNEEVVDGNNDGERSVEAKGEYVYHDVELNEANVKVGANEAKEEEKRGGEYVESGTVQDHNDENLEVKEAKDVERSDIVDVEEHLEVREAKDVEGSNNFDVEDVCMEEPGHEGKVITEMQFKGEAVGNQSS